MNFGGMGSGFGRMGARGGGGVAPPTEMQVRAKKILASIEGATPTLVMAVPPTLTHNADYVGSDVTGGYIFEQTPNILLSDDRIQQVSGLWAAKSGNSHGAAYITQSGAKSGISKGLGVAFKFTGTAFDFAINGFAFTGNKVFRIRVDGEWTHADDQNNPTNQDAYTKVTFSSPATRLIEIYFDAGVQVYGFNLNVGGAIALPDADTAEVKFMSFGDSYTQGFNGDNIRSGMAHALGAGLGVRNPIVSGVGGQGLATTSQGHTFTSRAQAGDTELFGSLDLIFVYGSVNDSNKVAATIQTNAASLLDEVQDRNVNAFIVALSSFTATGAAVDATRNAAALNGFNASADAARTLVLDRTAISGFPTAATTGDNVHPDQADIDGYVTKLVPLIQSWLETKS